MRLVPSIIIKSSSNFLSDRSKAVLILWVLFVICVSCLIVLSVPYSLVVTCWERDDILALLYAMFSWVFCHFLIWCPGSGVVFYRNGFLIFAFFLTLYRLPNSVPFQDWFLSCVCYVFVRVCLYAPNGHLLGKGWPLGYRLWCLTVGLSLSHSYPGSGVVLDCIDS